MTKDATKQLADAVLPLVRTRTDLHRWSAANRYGYDAHQAVNLLTDAARTQPAPVVFAVTQRAIASTLRAIARADDSSGIIGDAIRMMLQLHAELACKAPPTPAKLVNWMIAFQFDNVVDYFNIDPVAYAAALGETGLVRYRTELDQIAAQLPPDPTPEEEQRIFSQRIPHPDQWDQLISTRLTRGILEWNARRLAVLDKDVDAIIATHARDKKVAAWYHDTAKALAEIGEYDLAIDWARQATMFGPGHQSITAGHYWHKLVAEHHPENELATLQTLFVRWPTSEHATLIYQAVEDQWPNHREQVMDALKQHPAQAVSFALGALQDPQQAWELAHELELDNPHLWETLADQYQTIDPAAVLPIYTQIVHDTLKQANAKNYKTAARRLAQMRLLTAGTPLATQVDQLITELRQTHHRRPRLQTEFDKAGLPKI